MCIRDSIYIIRGDYDLTDLRLQQSEVLAARWACADEIMDMIDSEEFVPYHKSYIQLLFDTAVRPVYL